MTILHLDSSPRPGSYSRQLSQAFVAGIRSIDENAVVLRRDLIAVPPPFVDEAWVNNAFLPEKDRAPGSLSSSDELTDEFLSADVIALGMPMYNLGVPAIVKAWIDQIVRAGKTFTATPEGFAGIAGGRTVVSLIARNGQFGAGEVLEALNHQEPYLKDVLGFIGVTDVRSLALQDVFSDSVSIRADDRISEAFALGRLVAEERSKD